VLTCTAPVQAQPQLQLLLLQRDVNQHAAGASAHLTAEAELANALDLVVIPYHDLPQQHLQTSESEFHSRKRESQLLLCQNLQERNDRHDAELGAAAMLQPISGQSGCCSSAVHTLVGGYLGAGPPPTMARMLHLNSISTMPIPPLLKPRQNCSKAEDCKVDAHHRSALTVCT
jgi:hypothetical protein